MTEKQQIEEMAKKIYKSAKICDCRLCQDCEYHKKGKVGKYSCQCIAIAEELINQGYRKIDEGAVVLTKEEYESLKNESADIAKDYQEMAKFYDEKCEELDQARKETAKEILQELYDACKDDTYGQVVVDFSALESLAKQYGVEVE